MPQHFSSVPKKILGRKGTTEHTLFNTSLNRRCTKVFAKVPLDVERRSDIDRTTGKEMVREQDSVSGVFTETSHRAESCWCLVSYICQVSKRLKVRSWQVQTSLSVIVFTCYQTLVNIFLFLIAKKQAFLTKFRVF